MKILLVQPESSERMVGFTSMIRPEPLALEIIAATVPEHEVQILDMRVDSTLETTLAEFAPDLVGITGYTTDVPRMRHICSQVKAISPETATVVGGYHATLCPEDFDLEAVDYIVCGEGELTFPELVTAVEEGRGVEGIDGIIYRRRGHQVATRMRELFPNLDNLPLAARHLTDRYRQHYHFHFWENPYLIETARGCPFRCTFCAVWKFHRGKCRYKRAETIFHELKAIPSPVICFADDNFLQDIRRAEKLYRLAKRDGFSAQFWMQARADTIVKHPNIIAKWAEIGLDSVLIGFERFREEELAKFNKRTSVEMNEKAAAILSANGVDIWGSFIVDPDWSKFDFDFLIDYVHRLKVSFPVFTVLTPLPGTAFFQEKLKELKTRNYEVFDFLHSVLPTKLPVQEFYSNLARLYASTTMGLKELKQRVRAGRIPISALKRVREVLSDVTNPQAYLNSMESI